MKTAKKFSTLVIAVIMLLSAITNVFAVDSSELTTETEVIISESTEQPQEVINLDETTISDTTEISPVSEKIFGLTLTPEKAYVLPNDTLQLEVSFLTSPPEPPLRTEFIEEEQTEVLITESETSKKLTEVPEETTEAAEETTALQEEVTESQTEFSDVTEETTELQTETPTEEPTEYLTEAVTEQPTTEISADKIKAVYENVTEDLNISLDTDSDLIYNENDKYSDLIWSSSDESVAAVGYNGLVYSRELGTAVITVSTPDGTFSASSEINVVEEIPEEIDASVMTLDAVYRVAISPNTTWSDKPRHWPVKLSTEFGVNFDVYKCDANGNYIGNEADISSLLNWQSSDTSVATVDIYGRVTGRKNGSTTITVSAKNGDTIQVYNTVHVTVYTPYSSTRTGIATAWVNQYKSTVSNCHDDRLAGTVSPGTRLDLYGTSGGYVLGSIQGETGKYYLWADNLYDHTNGEITICKDGNFSDTRRHWDMYNTQTISLALLNSGSATWTTSDANIAKVNNSSSYSGRTVTINPVAEGTAYITANSGGKIDVIHVTVITRFTQNGKTINKMGITQVWCNNFKCSHNKCTILDRKVGTTNEKMLVTLYGESGGYYYANPVGTNLYIYLWKSNINMQSWYKQKDLENLNPGDTNGRYAQQGMAIDSNDCFSFEVRTVNGSEEHRLYRYRISTGERIQMHPVTSETNSTPNLDLSLLHANDAAIVRFNENGEIVPYIFVMAYSSVAENSIVKLGFNESGQYWKVASYPIPFGIQIAGITVTSADCTNSATFLLKSDDYFYEATIPSNLTDNTAIWSVAPSPKVTLGGSNTPEGTAQGIHYERSNDNLYLAYFYISSEDIGNNEVVAEKKNKNNVYVYSNVKNTSGTIGYNYSYNINKEYTPNQYFEIESVGFRSESTNDNYLWFSTFEGESVNGGIYSSTVITR